MGGESRPLSRTEVDLLRKVAAGIEVSPPRFRQQKGDRRDSHDHGHGHGHGRDRDRERSHAKTGIKPGRPPRGPKEGQGAAPLHPADRRQRRAHAGDHHRQHLLSTADA